MNSHPLGPGRFYRTTGVAHRSIKDKVAIRFRYQLLFKRRSRKFLLIGSRPNQMPK